MKIFKYSLPEGKLLICDKVLTADNFFKRLCGLIFKKPLKKSEALLIEDCKSIHTLGLRYSIDAVFIDGEGEIITVFENIRPWRFMPYVGRANAVIEFKGGFIKEMSLCVGDRILFG